MREAAAAAAEPGIARLGDGLWRLSGEVGPLRESKIVLQGLICPVSCELACIGGMAGISGRYRRTFDQNPRSRNCSLPRSDLYYWEDEGFW